MRRRGGTLLDDTTATVRTWISIIRPRSCERMTIKEKGREERQMGRVITNPLTRLMSEKCLFTCGETTQLNTMHWQRMVAK